MEDGRGRSIDESTFEFSQWGQGFCPLIRGSPGNVGTCVNVPGEFEHLGSVFTVIQ